MAKRWFKKTRTPLPKETMKLLPKKLMGSCFLLLFFSIVSLFSGVGNTAEIRFQDITGRTVSLKKTPKRIVCVAPGTLRLILYLGAVESVVGVEEMEKRYPDSRPYWMAYPELENRPVIGPGGPVSINKEPDLEAILTVKPELLFISYMEKARADILSRKLNIPVVVLSYGPFGSFDETIYRSLRIAGTALGRTERAETVIEFIESAKADLAIRTKRLSNNDPVKASDTTKYENQNTRKDGDSHIKNFLTKELSKQPRLTAYIGGIGWKGTQGIESTDEHYAPFQWCGVTNAAKGICPEKGHCFIDKERLISLDPDTIFIDGGANPVFKEEIKKKRPIYDALTAFREGKVFSLHPFNWYMTNIATVLSDAYAVGKILSPTSFDDLDLAEKSDEIYRFLLGNPLYEKMALIYGPNGEKI